MCGRAVHSRARTHNRRCARSRRRRSGSAVRRKKKRKKYRVWALPCAWLRLSNGPPRRNACLLDTGVADGLSPFLRAYTRRRYSKNDGLGRELSRRVCSTTPLQVRLRARSGARAQMAMRTVALTKEVVAVRRSSEQGTQAKKVAERFLQQFSARKGPKGAQDLDALNEEYISKVA